MSETLQINTEAQALITGKQAWHYGVFPYDALNGSIHFYTTGNLSDETLKDELELITGKIVHLQKTDSDLMTDLLNKFYPNEQPDSRQQKEFYYGEADNFLNHL